MEINVIAVGSDVALSHNREPWQDWLKTDEMVLTTEHSRSSYGMPVLADPATGQAFGPGDLPAVRLHISCNSVSQGEAIQSGASGWPVEFYSFCPQCDRRTVAEPKSNETKGHAVNCSLSGFAPPWRNSSG